MVEAKTVENELSVEEFLDAVEPARRKEDGKALKEMMGRLTGWPAKMWGKSIVGFGAYDYTYDSGHSGRAMIVGYSPRKANLVLYIMNGFGEYDEMLSELGKHKTGKSCLYINKLADIDLNVLEEMIKKSVTYMKAKYSV